jgi:hypothetical protein
MFIHFLHFPSICHFRPRTIWPMREDPSCLAVYPSLLLSSALPCTHFRYHFHLISGPNSARPNNIALRRPLAQSKLSPDPPLDKRPEPNAMAILPPLKANATTVHYPEKGKSPTGFRHLIVGVLCIRRMTGRMKVQFLL